MLPPAGWYTLNWFPVRAWLGQAEKGCYCSVTWYTQTLLRVTWLTWRLLDPGRAQHSGCTRVLRPGNHLAALRWTAHRDSCVCQVHSSPNLVPKVGTMRWSSPHLSSTIYITERCASKGLITKTEQIVLSCPLLFSQLNRSHWFWAKIFFLLVFYYYCYY